MTPQGVHFDPQDPLDRALRMLPDPRAPRTLAPRVMAAVHARLAHPPARTWFEWPLVWRISSITAAVLMLVAVWIVWPMAVGWAQPAVDAATVRFVALQHGATAVLSVFSVVFRSVWHPVVMPFVVFLTVMTIACATVGAMLGRVALGGASR
jgi:hypothetical protein